MVLPKDTAYDRRRTILCIRSRRDEALLDTALAGYHCCVVHDAHLACRKARLGAFDLYLTVDPHSTSAAVECWRGMREFDRNTPFLFVLRERLPSSVEGELVPGVDGHVLRADGVSALVHATQHLIMQAERRSLDAWREEALALSEDVRERLARLEWRVHLSRASVARAQEHVMRAYALDSFTRLGGTKSFFERRWLEAYEQALERTAEWSP